jgi:hypothetical protein
MDEIKLNINNEITLGKSPTLNQSEKIDFTKMDIEAETLQEVNDILAGFKSRQATEQARYEDAVDSQFWIAICFQTSEQAEEFLKKTGWLDIGEKYLDGLEVAQRMGINLTSDIPPIQRFKIDSTLLEMSRPLRDTGQ